MSHLTRPPTSKPRGEQMLRIFCTSSGVRGASVSSLLIKTARNPHHPRAARVFRGNHVLLPPRTALLRDVVRRPGGAERPRRQHHRNEPSVFDDVNAPQCRDVLEKTAELFFASLAETRFAI
jgi:hypothetical protein